MPRVQPRSADERELDQMLDEFWLTIAALETKDEVKNFFRDLLSKTEAVMLARRVRIAKSLLEGKSYDEVQKELHTSPITIAGVQRWLSSGFDGYAKVVPKLEKELARLQAKREGKIPSKDPFSFKNLKRKYPLHFLLFNIYDAFMDEGPKKPEKGRREKKGGR